MKLLKLNFIIVLLISFLFTSCKKDNVCIEGEGTVTTQTLSVPNFTGISSNGVNDIVIVQGSNQVVTATGHPNIINLIETDVSNGIWDIELEDGCYEDYELTFLITTPNIEKVEINGVGKIEINDFENQGDFEVEINGAGNVELNSFTGTENFDIKTYGVGKIIGNADFPDLKKLDITVKGSGDFEGFPIITQECNIDIEGSGNCEVNVTDKLDIKISGSGNVYYKGNPTITTDISGTGILIDEN